MSKIQYILFDAANTLIYKPSFYTKFAEVLMHHGISVDNNDLHRVHKLISECYHFPDRTSREFYSQFNKEVLYALGIIPDHELLNEVFDSCSYLPWQKFDDADFVFTLPQKKAVLSNFHKGLHEILSNVFSAGFKEITISESEGVRKPDLVFFEKAIEKLDTAPSNILYVGDSIKLDIEPALKVGMNAWLIDRDNYFPSCSRRLNSLTELDNVLNILNNKDE